jgi:hypothetical protein
MMRLSRSSIILERWLLNIVSRPEPYWEPIVSDSAALEKDWENLWAKEIYEDEYYYASQLFEHNWQPRTMG